jgi:hypothetical protein
MLAKTKQYIISVMIISSRSAKTINPDPSVNKNGGTIIV